MTRLNGVMFRRCTIALAFVLGACGSAEAVDTDQSAPPTAAPTVPGVGQLPDAIPLDEGERDPEEPMVSVVVTRPVDSDGVVVESVAERVNGNRLLVIGDSILASTATRYGGELCAALNPIGWSVEVNAEPGRFIPFGNEVAAARLDVDDQDDFDAVVIHLGSNYRGDEDEYFEQLSELLYRAAPRPTLLLTVTEYEPQWSEVNDVIEELASLYDNVTVIDWEKIARAPGVLSRDGLHPGSQGETVLVEQIAVALGELDTDDAECLSSSFTDDSAVNGGGGSGGSSSSGSSDESPSGSSDESSSGSSDESPNGSSGGSSSGSSGGSSSGGTSSGTTSGGSSGDATDGSSGGDTTDGSSGGGTSGGDATGGGTTGGDATGGDTTDGDTSGGSTGSLGGVTTNSTATTVAAATDGPTPTDGTG